MFDSFDTIQNDDMHAILLNAIGIVSFNFPTFKEAWTLTSIVKISVAKLWF
jgi:hypothetical protein